MVRPWPSSPPAAAVPTNWEALIRSLPWDVGTALAIVGCESGGRWWAVNPRSGAAGLFQILNGPLDPEANVRLAFSMWQSRGWQPWYSSKGCW